MLFLIVEKYVFEIPFGADAGLCIIVPSVWWLVPGVRIRGYKGHMPLFFAIFLVKVSLCSSENFPFCSFAQ